MCAISCAGSTGEQYGLACIGEQYGLAAWARVCLALYFSHTRVHYILVSGTVVPAMGAGVCVLPGARGVKSIIRCGNITHTVVWQPLTRMYYFILCDTTLGTFAYAGRVPAWWVVVSFKYPLA